MLGSSSCTIKMTLFCSSFFVIFTFFFLSLSIASPLTPLFLSLNCSEPSNGTSFHDQQIKPLLENHIVWLKNGRFVTFDHEHFTGVMQCRVGLDQRNCSLCAQHAYNTISTLCLNSYVVTAWFDGCYIQYNHKNFSIPDHSITTRSCMNRTGVTNPIQYKPALETLLLRLRAEVNLGNHHGFSYGELNYGSNSKFYGLVECVRSLSVKGCELCIGEASDRFNGSCGDKEGGIVVKRLCLVRFGTHKFYSESGGFSGGPAAVSVWQSEKGGGGGGGVKWKQSLVWLLGGCSIFLLVIIFFAWLLKRSVLNRAKVAIEDEKLESKVIIS